MRRIYQPGLQNQGICDEVRDLGGELRWRAGVSKKAG